MTAATIANGLTIEYDEHGDGEPLLLVMGLGGQLIAWPIGFVDLLTAEGFRVVRFDNRDIGLSSQIDAPAPTRRQVVQSAISRRLAKAAYTIDDMADDAAGLLDHLAIERAHVVGASMGGMIAQALAIRHPGKVRSLTSIMSNTGDHKHGRIKRSLLRKLPRLAARNADDAVERGVEVFRMTAGSHFDADAARTMGEEAFARSWRPEGAARQTVAIAASKDRTWDLGRVRVPTLVVHGLADPLVAAERRHGDGAGRPGLEARHVPGHGPRPAAAAVARHRRRDRRQRPAGDLTVDDRPTMVVLDVEGVLVPEIWIAVAERTGIDALRRTTRDEPDYDVLMRDRLDLLARHGLGLSAIQATIGELTPLPGAVAFLDDLRARTPVVLLSDTFAEFAGPLMAQLGRPTILCHNLEVVDDRIVGYRLRMADQKRHAVEAFQALGYRVLASGDSYNDVSMLLAADAGFLFRGAGPGPRGVPAAPGVRDVRRTDRGPRLTPPRVCRDAVCGAVNGTGGRSTAPQARSGGMNGSVRRATLQ